MSEFKILLIDDDVEQEQQLKEAIDKLNKNWEPHTVPNKTYFLAFVNFSKRFLASFSTLAAISAFVRAAL